MQRLYQWEKQILLKLNAGSHPLTDRLMMNLTRLGNGGLVWIVSGLLLMGAGWRVEGLLVLVSLAATALLINLVIKPIFTRKRPYELLKSLRTLISPPFGSSFPSGHAASSFAAASILWFFNIPFRYMALVLALLIAFSRVYLFVHFPSDVLVGMISGAFISYLVYLFALRLGIQEIWDRLEHLFSLMEQARSGLRQVVEQGTQIGVGLWDMCRTHVSVLSR